MDDARGAGTRLRSVLAAIDAEGQLFWVVGVAVATLAVPLDAHLGTESREWSRWMLFGTLFPLAALALRLLPAPWLRALLAGLASVVVARVLVALPRWDAVCLGALSGGLASLASRSDRPAMPAFAIGAVVGGVSWHLARTLLITRPVVGTPPEDFDVLLTWPRIVVTLVVTALVLADLRPAPPRPPRAWVRVADLLALVFIALNALRSDTLDFGWTAPHHWGAIAGPAALVRDGASPLWDIPVQYGLLSTLTIAYLPARNVFQAFYLVDAAMLAGTAAFIYFVLRLRRPTVPGVVFALALAVSAVFLVCGNPILLLGVIQSPAAGAFRFGWCYALFAILLAESAAPEPRRGRWIRLGHATYLVGFLWSAESACYTSAIWLPSRVWSGVRTRMVAGPARWPALVRAGIGALAVPAASLAAAFGAIEVLHRLAYARPPDWRVFVDYLLTFQAGFNAVTIAADGPVWVLVVVGCCVVALAVDMAARSPKHPALVVLVGLYGGLWGVASYFVGRSAAVNLTNLAPVICAVIGSLLWLLDRAPVSPGVARTVRVACVPICAMILLVPVGSPGLVLTSRGRDAQGGTYAFGRWLGALRGYTLDVAPKLSDDAPELIALLEQEHVGPEEPLVYWNDGLAFRGGDPSVVHFPHSWSPLVPLSLMIPLPLERAAVYHHRFVERRPLDGWLVRRPVLTGADQSFMGLLSTTHEVVRTVEGQNWVLERWRVRGRSPTPDAPE